MKRETLQKLAHLGAGLLTLVHGFEELEKGILHTAAGYFIAAIAFIVVAGAHKTITRKFMQGDVAIFLIEALIILYSGWHYKAKGQMWLYFAMAAAGALYVLFALMSIKRDSHIRKSRSRKHRSRSSRRNKIPSEEFLRTQRPINTEGEN